MVVKRGSRVPALTAAGTDGPREPYCSHVLSHAGCRRERSNATGGQTGRRRRARAPPRSHAVCAPHAVPAPAPLEQPPQVQA